MTAHYDRIGRTLLVTPCPYGGHRQRTESFYVPPADAPVSPGRSDQVCLTVSHNVIYRVIDYLPEHLGTGKDAIQVEAWAEGYWDGKVSTIPSAGLRQSKYVPCPPALPSAGFRYYKETAK